MNLAVIKNGVTSRLGLQILKTRKHSPELLFVGGIVGIVGATVLACKATLEMDEILDVSEAQHEKADSIDDVRYSETSRKRDHQKIKAQCAGRIARAYAPAVALGTVSVAALTGSHIILKRRNVALMAAYSVLERSISEYRRKVVDEYGEDKDQELMYGIKEIDVHNPEKGTVESHRVAHHLSMYSRVFDEKNVNWEPFPHYNQHFLALQEKFANDRLNAYGYLFLNDVYEALGIERSPEGQIVGWLKGVGDVEVSFGIFKNDKFTATRFANGEEKSIWLDFNVCGPIWDKI